MKNKVITTLLIGLIGIVGCMHTRDTCFAPVGGDGGRVVTKNKYKIVELKFNSDNPNVDMIPQNLLEQQRINGSMKLFQPDVFSDDGIQVLLRTRPPDLTGRNSVYKSNLLFIISLTTWPILSSGTYFSRNTIEVVDNPEACTVFDLYTRSDGAMSMALPTALLFFPGEPTPPEHINPVTTMTKHDVFGIIGGYDTDIYSDATYEALAYTLAVKLKEMEDKGLIDVVASNRPKQSVTQMYSVSDKYEIADFRKDDDCEYRYTFALKRRDGSGVSLRESRELQKVLRSMIREDYIASFPDAAKSVVIDFPEYSLRNGSVMGKAVALTFEVQSLRYDSNRRVGTMRVRIGENQFEDARRFVKKNIESLARDKNIALDGKAIPPSATVYLEGETLKNGILEMTFKTE